MSPVTQQTIMIQRQRLIAFGRPLDEQNLRIALRSVGAIKDTESAELIAQNNGFVQFVCQLVLSNDDKYIDPPVVTVHESGDWERV